MDKHQKPKKPSPEFPLYPHANGQWAKRIGGNITYFGTWQDPEAALLAYNEFIVNGPPEKGSTSGKKTTSKSSSTRERFPEVPENFPLKPHINGQWYKYIHGRYVYFGRAEDPFGALEKYYKQRESLEAGRTPDKRTQGALTLKELINIYLHNQDLLVQSERLKPRTFREAEVECKRLISFFGPSITIESITPSDWDQYYQSLPKSWGLVTLRNCVARTKAIFNFASSDEQQLTNSKMRFGNLFAKPPKSSIKRESRGRAKKFYSAEEIHLLLNAADPAMKAMVLLGVNCGYGNEDCGLLPLSVLNLKTGWINYDRHKNQKERRCNLWPETIEALEKYLEVRPTPRPQYSEYVFITKYGNIYYRDKNDNVCRNFGKLLTLSGLEKTGRGFYSLRHVTQTIGDQTNNPVALGYIMGHADDWADMSAVYRTHITDESLKEVTDHIRQWLYPLPTLYDNSVNDV